MGWVKLNTMKKRTVILVFIAVVFAGGIATIVGYNIHLVMDR